MIACRDRRKSSRAEFLFQHWIDGRIIRIHHHNAVFEHQLERLVVARHDHSERGVTRFPESADNDERVIAATLINASAANA